MAAGLDQLPATFQTLALVTQDLVTNKPKKALYSGAEMTWFWIWESHTKAQSPTNSAFHAYLVLVALDRKMPALTDEELIFFVAK